LYDFHKCFGWSSVLPLVDTVMLIWGIYVEKDYIEMSSLNCYASARN
jgi:hypothetical protein